MSRQNGNGSRHLASASGARRTLVSKAGSGAEAALLTCRQPSPRTVPSQSLLGLATSPTAGTRRMVGSGPAQSVVSGYVSTSGPIGQRFNGALDRLGVGCGCSSSRHMVEQSVLAAAKTSMSSSPSITSMATGQLIDVMSQLLSQTSTDGSRRRASHLGSGSSV